MKKIYYILLGLLWILVVITSSTNVYAQEDGMEFEAILFEDIPISIASKREEKIWDAPSVVTVITADEMRRYGARHLRDVIDRTTNAEVVGSNVFMHNAVFMRGGGKAHTDTTILLLLNGRPIHEAIGGGINADIYANFPIETIERLEIIRGPGSALYGTNAFRGVLNIVTKKAEDDVEFQFSNTNGTFDTRRTNITGGGEYKGLNFYAGFNYLDSDGWNWTATDEVGTFGTVNKFIESLQGVLQAEYKGLTFNMIIGSFNQFMAGIPFILPSNVSNIDLDRVFMDMGYKHKITDDWDVSINYTYNGHDFITESPPLTVTTSESRGYLIEITTHGNIGEKINVVSGAVYDNLRGQSGVSTVVDFDTWRRNFYTQVDYLVKDWFKLISGIQVNKAEESETDISLRFGTIMNFSKSWGAKILFGEAFRSPFGADLFTQAAPALVGEPSLKPEKISTYDFQLFYHDPKYEAALTLFQSNVEDIHTRIVVDGNTTFANAGAIDTHGIEFEGKAKLNDALSLIGNMSYQQNGDANGEDDSIFNPNFMAKLGVSYESKKGITFSAFNSHFGDAANIDSIATTTTVNPEADEYNLLTANLILDIPTLLNKPDMVDMTVSVYGDNLLDSEITYPSFFRTGVNTLPHHSGQAFYGTITFKY